MKEQAMSDELLRQFLLDNVNDEERARIESLFLTDSEVRERVLAAEQDLIEDYLENSLTTADKERFLSRYAQTTAQRRKLKITKSIKNWAITEAAVSQTVPSTISIWSRAGVWLRQRATFIVPIAVATVMAIIVAAVWLNSRMEQRNRQLSIEQELARLNTQSSLREVPPQMVSVELRPVSVRSVERRPELKTSADVRIVELRLPWVQKERYSTYQAEVRRVGDDELFTIRSLQAENDGQYAIRIRLPAYILRRGDYQIHLRGINADGAASPFEEYTFAIGD